MNVDVKLIERVIRAQIETLDYIEKAFEDGSEMQNRAIGEAVGLRTALLMLTDASYLESLAKIYVKEV